MGTDIVGRVAVVGTVVFVVLAFVSLLSLPVEAFLAVAAAADFVAAVATQHDVVLQVAFVVHVVAVAAAALRL